MSAAGERFSENSLLDAAAAVGRALDVASADLVDRRVLVELVALAAIAREHVLVLGPPGTAKSAAVRLISSCLGGSYFEYLLGRFTEPAEIFGPIDLRRLQDGVFETVTAGMLPEAEIAFLDEVFQGSTAILNTLLGILNERKFRRGAVALDCPLRVVVGASNELPADPSLAAFADRFLLRHFVAPIAEPRLEDLLEAGWRLADSPAAAVASLADLDVLAAAARRADLSVVRPLLAEAVRLLAQGGHPAFGSAAGQEPAFNRGGGVARPAPRAGRPRSLALWFSFCRTRPASRSAATRSSRCSRIAGAPPCRRRPRRRRGRSPRGASGCGRTRCGRSARPRRRRRSRPLLREIDAELPADARGEELAGLRAELAARLAPGPAAAAVSEA